MKESSSWSRYLFVSIVGLLLILLVGGGLLLAGLVPASFAERLTTAFSIPARLIQILAFLLLSVSGVIFIRYSGLAPQSNSLTTAELKPEVPRSAPHLIGDQFDSHVAEALRDVRLKDVDYDDTEPQQVLSNTTQTAIRLAFSCDDDEAARILADGEWTTDPVAKAFLSESKKAPPGFRLLRWAKPGQAYEIALDRTTHATYQLISQTRADVQRVERRSPTAKTNDLLAPVRALLLGQQSEPVTVETGSVSRADRQQSGVNPPSPAAATERSVEDDE